ncbi:MAG: ankyrin repeat domain-containing protein [Gemmatimonadaceae bacterium]
MSDPVASFLHEAVWHGSLQPAEEILSAHPEVASASIHAAAVLGDDSTVERFIQLDKNNATVNAPPYDTNALVYLCMSKYLRLDESRTPRFLRAAAALLDAGADANSGFWTTGKHPEFETALYGAAGIAHHVEMTRLLLERGADPNDDEAAYHSPETYENGAMQLLVETGKLTPENLVMMLLRKHDWHDYDGQKYLLEHGADPNRKWKNGWRPMHHALARDNRIETIELLLEHGADPTLKDDGESAVATAAHRGRRDVLELFETRGIPIQLSNADELIAACAKNDSTAVRALAREEWTGVDEIMTNSGQLIVEFAGNGNTDGVRQLIDIGIGVNSQFVKGDGYWDLAPKATALHNAAWRLRHDTVRFLVERGANVNAKDGKGRTPLMLAVRASVDSYWTRLRSPESVDVLLNAGASLDGVQFPSGYSEIDELLQSVTDTR